MKALRCTRLFTGILTMLVCQSAGAQPSYPIAGLSPSERPGQAPVIEGIDKNTAWYNKALTGVSKPYPGSLRFLEDQGRWHTPFIVPGMTGPYDIRGWHNE